MDEPRIEPVLPPVAIAVADAIGSATRPGPFVVAQLGQSLDGRIATRTGDSRWINGAAALDYLHLLRANVDAVVVGAGTIIADNPRLNVRRVRGSNPARVVIDPNGRIGSEGSWLNDDGAQRLIVMAADGDIAAGAAASRSDVRTIRLARSRSGIKPGDIISAQADVGKR